MPREPQDLTGQRFGKLVAARPTNERKHTSVVWECRCDCGNICLATQVALSKGDKKSCGCMSKYVRCERLHAVWKAMLNRCRNPQNREYKNYGARGISVCDEWKHYPNFEKWAFENGYDPDAPRGKCSIDRIDSDGDYCPENCRFVDMKVQCRNKRCNRSVVGSDGSRYGTAVELAEAVGLSKRTLSRRIESGAPIDGVVYRFADQAYGTANGVKAEFVS